MSATPTPNGSFKEARARIIRAFATARDHTGEPLLDGIPGEIAIYGAGRVGRDVLVALAQRGRPPSLILDRKPAAAEIQGVPVRHPSDPDLPQSRRAAVTVLLTVFNPDADPAEIRSFLRHEGYGRVVGFPELHRKFADELGGRYWLVAPEFYQGHESKILDALGLWADDESRDLYASVLSARLLADDRAFPRPTLDDQYFPADLPPLPSPIHLVDCGAYTGDTIEDALRRGLDIAGVCAFEPDPENFLALVAWNRERRAPVRFPIFLWPCAVGRSVGEGRFRTGEGAASGFVADGGVAVVCVALDDVVAGFPATHLKSDIEGAEPDALKGAAGLIRRARPRLAVCAYHRPEHLWTLPALVRHQHPAYDLLLRVHRFNTFDLVMYALPRP